MIHVFIGQDSQKAREDARALFVKTRENDIGAAVTRFDDISFDLTLATELLNAENLFGGGNILYFDGILDHIDGEAFYRTILKKDGHTVIIRETNPPKDLLAFFGRSGEVKAYPLMTNGEKRQDSFALSDALGRRDKKMAWVEFEKVRRRGAIMEEVHGTVYWAFKTMYLISVLAKPDAIATGMKEFTYKNYAVSAKKFTTVELVEKLRELKDMYHRAHRGEGDFEVMMEEFVLAV